MTRKRLSNPASGIVVTDDSQERPQGTSASVARRERSERGCRAGGVARSPNTSDIPVGGNAMIGLVATALVTIVVHNLALLPDQELKDVQSGVEHIVVSSGLTVRWVKDAPPLPEVSVHLMIRRQSGIGPRAAAPLVLGTTIREDSPRCGLCCVFYEPVLRFAHTHKRSVATILALVIAHELGHAFLPFPAHTTTGLMKPVWSEDDVRHFTQGAALFTATQFGFMRAAIAGGYS